MGERANKAGHIDTEGKMHELPVCQRCGNPIPAGEEEDHSYVLQREEDAEPTHYEIWLCRKCSEEIYDEAMGYLP